MSLHCVVGLQFGDEGKGRFTDLLCESIKPSFVVRFNGSSNSGHTLMVDGNKYVTHLLPSGIVYGIDCVIANGCLVNIVSLVKEIESFRELGFNKSNIYISDKASIVLPCHVESDCKKEDDSNRVKIGTTKSGVGPCMIDKVDRTGFKMFDIFRDDFIDRCKLKFDVDNEFINAVDYIKQFVCDTSLILNRSYALGEDILFEGAQSFQLDIDFGTYPFVTSTNCISSYALVSAGLPPQAGADMFVYGVMKAYTTRVGEGSFITMMDEETDEKVRTIGREYGATTGRNRKCGWLDLVPIKYACGINGVTDLCLVKSDVLNHFDNIKVCISYVNKEDENDDYLTLNDHMISNSNPYYISFDGWEKSDLSDNNFKKFVDFIQKFLQVNIKYISYGPNRNEYVKV